MSLIDFLFGVFVGALFFGFSCGVWGISVGVKGGREQGILIGESRANTTRDKAHYDACKLVRTFTPKNSPAVECYVCPGATDEECLVPSWKVGAP